MGIFYKKILEKYADRIPSVVYFAIVFAAKLMIFLHYMEIMYMKKELLNMFLILDIKIK